MRVRSRTAAQSGQGVSHPASLRRTGPDACSSGRVAVSGHPALLMASAIALRPACVEELVEIVLEARPDRRPLPPAGGRSKADIEGQRKDVVPNAITGLTGRT